MLTRSADYRTHIKAPARRFVPKVEMYFDGDDMDPVVFDGDDILNFSLLEEAQSTSNNPLGFVTSNAFDIELDNSSRDFTPTNTLGAYYDKVRPNILVKPYLGLVLTEDPLDVEYLPLGIFRTGDWSTPSRSIGATVQCFDNLYSLLNTDTPDLIVTVNTTVGLMFERLFLALGLTSDDFVIDSSLIQPVRIAWYPSGIVRDTLQTLADAGFCSVRTDRTGRIVVQSTLVSGSVQETYTDDDSVISSENPQKLLNIYSKARVGYRLPYIKQNNLLIENDNLYIPNGGTTLSGIDFNAEDIPVVEVSEVRLVGATNSFVEDVSFGANTITIQIMNALAGETVRLEVYGYGTGSHTSSREAIDTDMTTLYGERELTLFNPFIQALDTAQTYANKLLTYVSDPLNDYEVNFRGDPALEISDIIQIINPSDNLGTIEVFPYRSQLEFDGGLRQTIAAKRAVPLQTWGFVGPGQRVRIIL